MLSAQPTETAGQTGSLSHNGPDTEEPTIEMLKPEIELSQTKQMVQSETTQQPADIIVEQPPKKIGVLMAWYNKQVKAFSKLIDNFLNKIIQKNFPKKDTIKYVK